MSLTIGIRFLTGYCATAKSKVDPEPEWPPHPARLYLALAAGYFEFGEDPQEQSALEWLEALQPPELCLTGNELSAEAIPTFVPMNDSRAVSRGGTIQSAPQLKRHRAERMFPRTHLPPEQDAIYLRWSDVSDDALEQHRQAIESLCHRVGRLGHSSSLVQVWLADEVPGDLVVMEPNQQGSTSTMRVVSETSGTLERLAIAFQTPPNFRAEIKTAVGYRRRKTAAISNAVATSFDANLVILKLEPDSSRFQWMQLETTLLLSATLRQAILKRCDGTIPESISGHVADGSVSKSEHIAMLPLPFVSDSNIYADGHLLGVAIALPRNMAEPERERLKKAIREISDEPSDVDDESGEEPRRIGTGLGFPSGPGGLGQWRLEELGLLESLAHNLRSDTWTAAPAGSVSWATVTPVVFDQHGKSRSKGAYLDECAVSVRESISRVVTDAKIIDLKVSGVSPLRGVPTARQFPRLKRKDGSERRHMHVQVLFDRPVIGPLLAGAGRYRGYGLFRPVWEASK